MQNLNVADLLETALEFVDLYIYIVCKRNSVFGPLLNMNHHHLLNFDGVINTFAEQKA